MKFDSVIIGGEGKSTAIISTGQNALHFFSGSFESVVEKNERMIDFFAKAGIPLHYAPGVRLMPLGSFRPSALCLEDTDIFPTAKVGSKVLIVNFMGYHDFFSTFLAEGLEKEGMQCRIRLLDLPAGAAPAQSRRHAVCPDGPHPGPHLGEICPGSAAADQGRGHRGHSPGFRSQGSFHPGAYPGRPSGAGNLCRNASAIGSRHPHPAAARTQLRTPRRNLPERRPCSESPDQRQSHHRCQYQKSGSTLFEGRYFHPGQRQLFFQRTTIQPL